MYFTDTHTHLYSEAFNEDSNQMMQRAIAEKVERFYLPNIDSSSIEPMKAIQRSYPENCYMMMGLHPCSVDDKVEVELAKIEAGLKDGSEYYAIGEIGIDLYWDKTHLDEQLYAFRQQINWAKELDLPIVIHCRESFDEIFSVLDEMNDEKLRGIFHCFTGDLEQAHHILSYGSFKLGIGGVLTFKNSGLDRVVEQLKVEDLVLETDAPYLAPTPYRGKRNESSYLIQVASRLSSILGISMEDLAEVTNQNADFIFSKSYSCEN